MTARITIPEPKYLYLQWSDYEVPDCLFSSPPGITTYLYGLITAPDFLSLHPTSDSNLQSLPLSPPLPVLSAPPPSPIQSLHHPCPHSAPTLITTIVENTFAGRKEDIPGGFNLPLGGAGGLLARLRGAFVAPVDWTGRSGVVTTGRDMLGYRIMDSWDEIVIPLGSSGRRLCHYAPQFMHMDVRELESYSQHDRSKTESNFRDLLEIRDRGEAVGDERREMINSGTGHHNAGVGKVVSLTGDIWLDGITGTGCPEESAKIEKGQRPTCFECRRSGTLQEGMSKDEEQQRQPCRVLMVRVVSVIPAQDRKSLKIGHLLSLPTEIGQFLEAAIQNGGSNAVRCCAATPILALPEGRDDFMRYMQCFLKKGLGAVLMQRESVICCMHHANEDSCDELYDSCFGNMGARVVFACSRVRGTYTCMEHNCSVITDCEVRFAWGKAKRETFKNEDVGGMLVEKLAKNPETRVHNTFHVSNLKKCHADEPLAVPLDGLHLDDKLHFVEEPLEIVGREVKRLKRSRIPLVKVRWNSKRGPEFTWEREDQFKKKYPHLFTKSAPSSSAAS
ncbi:hypothetical protein Tco_1370134 [Tanacetum coccineum]